MSKSSYTWHPCCDLKVQLESKFPYAEKASGVYIYDETGRRILDGISSWWCKALGHRHPKLLEVFLKQSQKFEHIITSDFSFETLEKLSEKLKDLVPGSVKVFYGGDGASAVEISLKMSLHSHYNRGETQRTMIATLENSYHGETCGALSVSHTPLFQEIYRPLCFESFVLKGVPYVSSIEDPLWEDCSKAWPKIEEQLDPIKGKLSALIIEPLIQGAGGMKLYSKDLLKRLRIWTRENGIHFIADEIMTGLGRTGKMLACDYAEISADFVCLGKGLTSGWVPFSAVIVSQEVVDSFESAKEGSPPFLHSHTYSGNALGAALALKTLEVLEKDFSWENFQEKSLFFSQRMEDLKVEFGCLENERSLGMVGAFEVKDSQQGEFLKKSAFEKGLLLRPLGKTIYWMPPLTITKEEIIEIKKITALCLQEIMGSPGRGCHPLPLAS
jgi:adenosylmethionine---8-amino-7-oxononanoate aminotransferase